MLSQLREYKQGGSVLMMCSFVLVACTDAPLSPSGGGPRSSQAPRYSDVYGCEGGDACVMDPLVGTADPSEPDCDDGYQAVMYSDLCDSPGDDTGGDDWGSGDPPSTVDGSGSGGGGSLPGDADGDGDAYDDGPVAWGACIAAVAGMTISMTAMQFYVDDMYEAADRLDSAERMLLAANENNTELAVILTLQFEVEDARRDYDAATQAFSIASGAAVGTLLAAAAACAPALLLPSP